MRRLLVPFLAVLVLAGAAAGIAAAVGADQNQNKKVQDASGRRVKNFTRVETFGDNQGNGNQGVNWLKVLVDPESRDVFAFQPQIVPANQQ